MESKQFGFWYKVKWFFLLKYSKICVSLLRFWYIINPLHEFELKVSFYMGDCDWLEVDDIIHRTIGRDSSGSGAGCGTRDIDWYLRKSELLEAIKRLEKLQSEHPEWQLNILDELHDADFLGVGY